MCYTWAGYDEMGAKYYLSFRGKKTANDFNITLLVSTFLNPLIEMAFQDHLKRLHQLLKHTHFCNTKKSKH